MKKTLLALLLALVLTAAPALAIPSPSDDFYILDEANVISNATEEYIIYNNDQLYDACGAQIVFAVVDDTEGEAIDDYAYDIFNEWGIGDSKKDNGFLVLMAIDDDNYYALPGTGLERAISAGTIKDLLDTYLEPDFAAKDYDAGAKALFNALFREVCDASSVALTAGNPAGSSIADKVTDRTTTRPAPEKAPAPVDEGGISFGTILIIIVVVIILICVLRSSGKRRRSRGSVPPPPPPPPHVPPVQTHVPPVPPRKPVIVPRRPIIIPRIDLGPRPGNGPRPSNTQRSSRPNIFGGSGRSGSGGRSMGGGASRSSRPSGGFSRGGRSGGGGGSRGGGAGRGR